MIDRTATASPKFLARTIGVLYLLTLLTGIFAQDFVSEKLIVSRDAAATAANILAHKGLYQIGFTVYMIEMACQIAMTVLFYVLLRPVNKSVALVGTTLGITGCIVKTFGRVFFLAPLYLQGNYLSVFSPDQLQALALAFLTVNDRAAAMGLAFFGFGDFLHGYLIFKSTFLPRFLGVISIIAALGWMTFAYPSLGYSLFLYLAMFGLLGALITIGWLLIKGVDEAKWRERAESASSFQPAALS